MTIATMAAAMLLLYQFAMAIFVGVGPPFILCLIFEQTKSLFQRWLLCGIGTLFSIAVLYVMTSIVLKLTINVAAALWTADIINNMLDTGSEGFSSQAMQQGGIGLLLTVLIISVPPMTAAFFQGTVGSFYFNSAFGHGGGGARQGPNGQLQPGLSSRDMEVDRMQSSRTEPGKLVRQIGRAMLSELVRTSTTEYEEPWLLQPHQLMP